ncbi:MAG: NB-ARC domain-containing protein, partial [Verrucomicrobiota bacterium]
DLKRDLQEQLGGLRSWLVGWRLVDDLNLSEWAVEGEEAESGASAPAESGTPGLISNAPPAPRPFFGRSGDLERVFAGLRGNEGAGGQRLMGLHGVPGVGKSTFLAHLAWEAVASGRYPDGVLWAALGQRSAAERLMLTDWCRRFNIPASGLVTRELAARLAERLLGKRMLLIVDDVWQANDLGLVQGLLHPTLSLLFSSRIPAVSFDVAAEPNSYHLDVLSEESCLDILKSFAPMVVDRHLTRCEELIDHLGKLPLALQVAGRLLGNRYRMGQGGEELFDSLPDGSAILEENPPPNMRPFIEETEGNITVAELIKRSVAGLPDLTRTCFFCLGVMPPKPATLSLDGIRSVWHFLDDPRPELAGLIDAGLVEPLTNGRFQMHAMFVAYAKAVLETVEDYEDL